MVLNVNGKYFNVCWESIALHTIAVTFMVASIWDGLAPLGVAIGIMIYDTIRYPYENILEIEPPEGSDDDDLDAA